MKINKLFPIICAMICLGIPFSQAVQLSDKDSGQIARVVGFLLSQTHFKRAALDDEISKQFLRKYMESLDYSRMVFLQSDFDEFSKIFNSNKRFLSGMTLGCDIPSSNVISLGTIVWSAFVVFKTFMPV